MKIPRNWMDEPEVFGAVTEALDQAASEGEIDAVDYGEDGDGYGGRGYIEIKIGEGRFSLDLFELR